MNQTKPTIRNEQYRIPTMAILVGICCLLIYYFHWVLRIEVVFSHFFYIPITLAAVWWKKRGLVVPLFLALLLLVNHQLSNLGLDWNFANDLMRATGFIVVGVTVSILSEKMRKAEVMLRRHTDNIERIVVERTEDLRETRDHLDNLIRYANAPIIVWNPANEITIFNQAFEKMIGRTEAEMLGQTLDVLFPEESLFDSMQKIENASNGDYWETLEIPILRRDGEIRIGLWNSANIYSEDGKTLLSTIAQGQDITERKRAEDQIQRRHRELTLLNRVITAASTTLEPKEVLEITCRELALALNLPQAAAALLNEAQTASIVVAEYLTEGHSSALDIVLPVEGNPATEYVIEKKAPLPVTDAQHDPRMAAIREEMQQRGTVSMLILPLMVRGQVVGTLGLDAVERREFSSEEIDLAASAVASAAQALENAHLFSQSNQRLERLETLQAIDRVISASFDINMTTSMFLEQALTHLEVDAADVLLFNPIGQTLECIGRKGFRTSALQHTHLRLGQGLAGQVALQQEIKFVPDLQEEEEILLASPDLSGEEFVAYYGVPLVAKGALKGVLEILHRTPLSMDDEWLMFLKALAGQAAIAIDNAVMFADVQRSNLELGMAYDSTLEGWAKAVELKDMETEGHSRRVVDLTNQMASQMEISSKELVHIRRGALLHDIGKMGIPDSILQKPGPLTDEEWTIMRKHPVYAFEWLSSINFLLPALEIPYSHHEKWDGSGYPQGLKGEQIPLAARIFAIVDVWDALRSDRPYRKAWAEEKTTEYIREQSGKHFDPRVVEVFFQLIASQSK